MLQTWRNQAAKEIKLKRPVTDRGNEVLGLVALRKRGVYIVDKENWVLERQAEIQA